MSILKEDKKLTTKGKWILGISAVVGLSIVFYFIHKHKKK